MLIGLYFHFSVLSPFYGLDEPQPFLNTVFFKTIIEIFLQVVDYEIIKTFY